MLRRKGEAESVICLFLGYVAEHDNGWSDCELKPALEPKTQLPYSFMSIPTETHIALSRRASSPGSIAILLSVATAANSSL
jgi:hypothetical protein